MLEFKGEKFNPAVFVIQVDDGFVADPIGLPPAEFNSFDELVTFLKKHFDQ